MVALDVHYGGVGARAACVGFGAWADASPAFERALRVDGGVAVYVPGELYVRELPALLAVLGILAEAPRVVIVDGYVTLADGAPGLGQRLYEALGARAAVVGVAKTEFRGARAVPVLRGGSRRPLFVTAAGMTPVAAAEAVRTMHGPHRMPTLIARADALARGR